MAMKSSGPLYQNNLGSAAKPIQWTSQMYRPNPVLQRYHRSRKEQKAKQKSERVGFPGSEGGSEYSTPASSQNFTQSSQMMDDSVNLPNSYSSEDSQSWSQRNFNTVGNCVPFFSNRSRPNSAGTVAKYAGDLKPFMEADSKQELKQYMEFAKQQARERDEKFDREMLGEFLTSARQCCEEANGIATKVSEKLDETSSNIINKLKECMEEMLPKVEMMQKIIQGKDDAETMLQNELSSIKSQLQQAVEQQNALKETLFEEMVNKQEQQAQNLAGVLNQATQSHTEILTEIKDCVMKPTTKSCDMWSQYSPQCNNFHIKSTVQRATDYSSVNLPKMTRCRKFPKFSSPVATVSPFRHTVGFYRQQPANKLYPSSSVNRSPLSNCNRQSNVSDRSDAVFVGTQSNRQIHEDMNRIDKDNNDDSVDALVNSLFGDEEENIHARPKKPPKRKNLRKNPSMNCESSVVDVLEISRDSQKENLPMEDDTDEEYPALSYHDVRLRRSNVQQTGRKMTTVLGQASDSDESDDIFCFTTTKHNQLKLG
ncbi:uncharacterized protein LOC143470052 isoform X2 [Clavelina lepadiformis]